METAPGQAHWAPGRPEQEGDERRSDNLHDSPLASVSSTALSTHRGNDGSGPRLADSGSAMFVAIPMNAYSATTRVA